MSYWSKEIIDKIRRGYYSAVYFNNTKDVLLKSKNFKKVTMQVFQKQDRSILCGVNEVIELFKIGTGYWNKNKWINTYSLLKIKSIKDGDVLKAWESVMHITGPYVYFAHLESLYLGILAQRTLIATNARKVVDAAKGKTIIFFADRFDHFLNQEGNGYAAHIGGIDNVCTQAHAAWWKGKPVGTFPHALIAIKGGDTEATALQFNTLIKSAHTIAVVDFDNDCIRTALEVARSLKKKLWGVRLDTPETNIDISLKKRGMKIRGVNSILVKLLRKELDKSGFSHVKIVVSGGFDVEKINQFEKERAPVDIYGVGSSLIRGNNDFTADVVRVEGKKIAKVGRSYKESRYLKRTY